MPTNTHSPTAYRHPRAGDKTDVGPINKTLTANHDSLDPALVSTNPHGVPDNSTRFFQCLTSADNETDAGLTNMTPDYDDFTPFTKHYGMHDDGTRASTTMTSTRRSWAPTATACTITARASTAMISTWRS